MERRDAQGSDAPYRSIESVLQPGESCLWWSKPSPRDAMEATWALCAMGFFMAFACWHIAVQNSADRTIATLCLGFACAAIALLPLYTYRWALTAVHAVTDRRVLTICEKSGNVSASHPFAHITWIASEGAGEGLHHVTLTIQCAPSDETACELWAGVRNAEEAVRILRQKTPSAPPFG
jgi:hypothetical protein